MQTTIKVITTGSFMLMDPLTGVSIEAETETEVALTSFIQDRIDQGQLSVVKVAPKAHPAKAAAK